MLKGNQFFRHYGKSLLKADDKEQKPKYSKEDFKRDWHMYKEIIRDSWIYLLTTFLNFTITLAIFPAVCSLVEPADPSGSDWDILYFVPVCCYVVFNLGDVIGKWAASWLQWPGPSMVGKIGLLVVVLARTAFIPLMMYCNVSPSDRKTEVKGKISQLVILTAYNFDFRLYLIRTGGTCST